VKGYSNTITDFHAFIRKFKILMKVKVEICRYLLSDTPDCELVSALRPVRACKMYL
jgi:hypothetical protein